MNCQTLLEINLYAYYFRESIKVRLTLSRGGRRINIIISPLLDRGGGIWDLNGKKRGTKEGEGTTDPENRRKNKTETLDSHKFKDNIHTREQTTRLELKYDLIIR